MTEIIVPTLGESVTEATVAKWLKAEGDSVAMDEPLVELETDKVTLEVNAPAAGTLGKIAVAEGENVEVGALLGEIGEGSGQAPAPEPEPKPESAPEPAPEPKEAASDPKLSPAVRKMVEDHFLDPSEINGTGKGGRITKEDVQAHLDTRGAKRGENDNVKGKETAPDAAHSAAHQLIGTHPLSDQDTDAAAAGPREERVRMTRLRQSIATRLKEAQHNAAMLTTFNEVDMTAVMDLRSRYKDAFEKKHGVKLGFMSFFVKAAVQALKEFPAVNAEIDGGDIVYKNYYDIGVAVSTQQGLVVPVVRDAERQTMARIEKNISDMGARAREGAISMEDMRGGTFTITNGGVFGSLMSTPILNPPQSGILGMHKIQSRPMVMPDGSIAARPMMYLALSYDHRIIDGREAVSFLVRIKDAIEDPQRLLIDI